MKQIVEKMLTEKPSPEKGTKKRLFFRSKNKQMRKSLQSYGMPAKLNNVIRSKRNLMLAQQTAAAKTTHTQQVKPSFSTKKIAFDAAP